MHFNKHPSKEDYMCYKHDSLGNVRLIASEAAIDLYNIPYTRQEEINLQLKTSRQVAAWLKESLSNPVDPIIISILHKTAEKTWPGKLEKTEQLIEKMKEIAETLSGDAMLKDDEKRIHAGIFCMMLSRETMAHNSIS